MINSQKHKITFELYRFVSLCRGLLLNNLYPHMCVQVCLLVCSLDHLSKKKKLLINSHLVFVITLAVIRHSGQMYIYMVCASN